MSIERTFGMIKPDGVKRVLTGEIIESLEIRGMTIVGLRKLTLPRSQAEALYAAHKGKDFFDPLIEFTCSGPVVLMAIEGPNAVTRYRDIVENVLRPRWFFPGKPLRENVVHGSDGPEAARAELALFFPEL